MAGGRNDGHKRRMERPSSVLSKAALRAPVSSILVKNGARSKSRSRQQSDPPQLLSPQRSTSTADAHANSNNDVTRARVYKAEAYEAKIRNASQDQRIEALQAELEEVKLFQMLEHEGNSEAKEREKKSKDDAELIEALAQELETMEKDLKTSQMRVEESQVRMGDLEHDLFERSKSENDVSATQSVEKAQWEKREADLKKQLERQHGEVRNAKKETKEGIFIMKELDSALRASRAERDDARSQLSTLRTETEQMQEQMAVEKESEVALQSMQNERDEARSELSTLREEVDVLNTQVDVLNTQCESLEQSNKELQNVLEMVQTQSGKKMEQIKCAVLEAQAREEKLKQDHDNLSESYEQQVKESREMESALEGMANQFEAQQEKMLTKAAAIEELENLNATNVADLKQQHSIKIDEMMRKNERVGSSLATRHAQELKMKDDILESRESNWGSNMMSLRGELTHAHSKNKAFEAVETSHLSEIEALKDSLNELKRSNSIDMEELHDELQTDNTNLKAEKDDLLHKLQRGLEIHKKTTMELEAKTLELHNLQSSTAAAQAETEYTASLKKDYTSAVTLSIERGKKIQTLEKNVETYQSQLNKLIQKIKRMEKKSQASIANGAGVADERLQAEVSSLQAKARESEAKISALKLELSLQSTETLRAEQLERDLANAQKDNDESQSKILNLQEALQDLEAALKTVSSRVLTPRKSASPKGHEEKRRQIEDGALKDYYAYRMQTEK
eukprot:CAMPEP_0201935620 /NCGR_PEP_ID=MMETSP0903-20130614/35852_1 /ASSEMBLY_ACC=CAM_ASM_000552 /TAXON_ID=420261 /ORGANISM="Thalassiosira antarctica, Strain CCMP982" /LENGTH=739 /DNA_ID=CAMNT_0048476083 /DNA_START=133 /DNA_END=2352 /DNA_ORIENTATION=-